MTAPDHHDASGAPDMDAIAAWLDYLRDVPDDVLADVVMRDGLCFWVFDRDAMPTLTGTYDPDPDRYLAAELCAGCPVQAECLELELRTAGADTVGVWGAMCETDRRALFPVWKLRHIGPESGGGDAR